MRLAIAGLTAWAVMRGFGFDSVTPMAQFASMTPYVAVASVLVTGAALLTRRWREGLLAVAVTLVMAGFVVPRAIGHRTAADGANAIPLRVLSINMLYGRARPREIVALIRRERPDVVSVQELTSEAVAGLRAAGIDAVLPYRYLRPREWAWGTGLYARYPLAGTAPLDRSSSYDMATAVLKVPGRDVRVVSVHTFAPHRRPGAVSRWRRDMELLGQGRADSRGPVRLLVGDFNATLDHSVFRALLGSGYQDAAATAGQGLVPTWPADWSLPPVTIDHVLADDEVAVREVRIEAIPGSDHRSVFAELLVPRAR